jgi:O-methyltransferase
MNKFLKKTNGLIKGIVFVIRPHAWLGWLRHPFLGISNTLALSKWMSKQDKHVPLNDFYVIKRDYARRYNLYASVIEQLGVDQEAVDYLEFGVFEGKSFLWWAATNTNPESRFYGFDTFEGLPESWGTFKQGDMLAAIPKVEDPRASLYKGLFQDTLPDFLRQTDLRNGKRKIVHMDADLFSSTLFTLTSMAPYLKKGDVLLFDEFNVPNHEFFAYKLFCESYYVKTRLLCAVNNYYQVALIIE